MELHDTGHSFGLKNDYDYSRNHHFTLDQQNSPTVMQFLTKTEWNQLPKGSTNCDDSFDYLPDTKMEEIILKKAGCLPKWSSLSNLGLKYCETELDFEKYFKANVESQDLLNELPNKCKYIAWKGSLERQNENVIDDTSALSIVLVMQNPEVFNSLKHFRL